MYDFLLSPDEYGSSSLVFPYWFQLLNWSHMDQITLLYLSTQVRFPFGGVRVTCHWSTLINSLVSTTTWTFDSQDKILFTFETAANMCASPPELTDELLKLDNVSHYTRDSIRYSRKGIYNCKSMMRLNKWKVWRFCISRLLIWHQKWVPRARHFAPFNRCCHMERKKEK